MQLQRPTFIQEQRLKMNPQLYQSIKLMALPVVDLRETIQAELERNPALEVIEDKTTISLDSAIKEVKEEDDYFEATSDSGFTRRGTDEDADEQQKFIEGALSRPETLQEHLLWQLRLQPIDDDVRRIGELLIQNLDADGFHKEPIDVLLKNEDPAKIAVALDLVRRLDPQGTCTTNYKESLMVQAQLMPDSPDGILEALEHLELLERGKITEVAKKIKRSEEAVKEILEHIKELSPFPGRQFDTSEVRYVTPDVQVIRKNDEFVIILNDEEIPVLGINPFFMKLSDGKDGEKPVRDFVRENIKEARWFIRSINQRNHTLLKVMRAIVEFQRAFFAKGPKYLAPLTLKDIAQEIGVHETTVSRIANGKYVQTEWGIFEIRYFFTNSISGAGSSGSRYSKEAVKEIIREIIQSEEGSLSDQDIADLLVRRGIPLARRTVAKYRKELDLGSSYTRS
ncbi:RNA polymerase factor sigma-54 [Gracilinema caldarium]|uniref:RNA polymerase, sigma 54 subunit, RpoN n=1 Tax=Gracilinema caldarium (strain ATCC 51460 / DSM 7334 / H1) TaxID=744872 RepID=F8F137_GRAC1|nr:RNA polymerase factor sigma-54 [Gracilinema caldarium]AEJ20827.1 RNA polymerase, sigma 54 subunit, RpoN [Gracilinema caldarium DSM 7334]